MLGIIPGMPNLVFILLASVLAGSAYLIDKRHKEGEWLTSIIRRN